MLQKIIYEKFLNYILIKFSIIEIIFKINISKHVIIKDQDSEHISRKIILLKQKILTSVKA